MKTLVLAILVSLSASAFAQDGAGTGAEEVIAAGGLTTVIGGCADARSIGSGENTEIIYTEPCYVQKTRLYRVVGSCSDPLLMKRFATSEEAFSYCGQLTSYQVAIGVTYDYGYRKYTCSCYNNQNGGE